MLFRAAVKAAVFSMLSSPVRPFATLPLTSLSPKLWKNASPLLSNPPPSLCKYSLYVLACLEDNYAYVLTLEKEDGSSDVVVVDVPCGESVSSLVSDLLGDRKNSKLTTLITHHHYDHTQVGIHGY